MAHPGLSGLGGKGCPGSKDPRRPVCVWRPWWKFLRGCFDPNAPRGRLSEWKQGWGELGLTHL